MAYEWTDGEVITAEKLNQTGGGESWIDLADTITISDGYTKNLYLKEKDGLVVFGGFLIPPTGGLDFSQSLSYTINITGMPHPLKNIRGGFITAATEHFPEYYTTIGITGSGKGTITIKAAELAPADTGVLATAYIPTLAYLVKE